VIKLHAEDLFGFTVQIEKTRGAFQADAKGVEDVVATLNGEIGFNGAGFLKALMTADSGVQLGLEMSVGDEEKGEFAGRPGMSGRVKGKRETRGASEAEKLATVEVRHFC
jgi:hypothetical protein